jgi:hypothetical protein
VRLDPGFFIGGGVSIIFTTPRLAIVQAYGRSNQLLFGKFSPDQA